MLDAKWWVQDQNVTIHPQIFINDNPSIHPSIHPIDLMHIQ